MIMFIHWHLVPVAVLPQYSRNATHRPFKKCACVFPQVHTLLKDVLLTKLKLLVHLQCMIED